MKKSLLTLFLCSLALSLGAMAAGQNSAGQTAAPSLDEQLLNAAAEGDTVP